MHTLPKEALDQLKKLFKENYNIELTDKECLEEAHDLLYIYAFSQGKLNFLNYVFDS